MEEAKPSKTAFGGVYVETSASERKNLDEKSPSVSHTLFPWEKTLRGWAFTQGNHVGRGGKGRWNIRPAAGGDDDVVIFAGA